MANMFQKKVVVEAHMSRLYDLVESIDSVNADATATAIAGLIEDVIGLKDEEIDVGMFLDNVCDELPNFIS